MEYRIELSEKTVKLLDKMKIKDKYNFERIVEHLRNLEDEPEHHENQRFSGHRKSSIFSCFGKPNSIVFITAIGHRRGIYE